MPLKRQNEDLKKLKSRQSITDNPGPDINPVYPIGKEVD